MFKTGDKVKCVDFSGTTGNQLREYTKKHGNEFTIDLTYSSGVYEGLVSLLENFYRLDENMVLKDRLRKLPKQNFFYKVVTLTLESTSIINSIQYKLNEWVNAPEGTRLFVFNTLEKAQTFLKIYRPLSRKIYKCQIRGNIAIYPAACCCDVKEYWDKLIPKIKNRHANWKSKEEFDKVVQVPTLGGYKSIGATSVKLLEEVVYNGMD